MSTRYIFLSASLMTLGKYRESEFAAAKEYINDCYDKSQLDFEYAKNQYKNDMEIKMIDREARKATDV